MSDSYPIAVVGANPTAFATIAALKRSGFHDLTHVARCDESAEDFTSPATTLSANLSRLVQALADLTQLSERSHAPSREQVRLNPSAYLLTELPLGKFIHDRYNAPHINIETSDLITLISGPAQFTSNEAPKLTELEQSHAVVCICAPYELPK